MQQKGRILIVDDNATNIAILEEVLAEHYFLRAAASGEETLEILKEFHPDIILLDIMMPGIDGYETCRRIRQNPAMNNVKVIMVSAKAMVEERLKGYEAGADDYITKPFGVGELLARVRVALRHAARAAGSGSTLLRFGEVEADMEKRQISRAGREVHLTPIEFRLLACLAQHLGMVVTHRQLLREVWGPSHVEHTHYLRIYMKQLRDKLEADPIRPQYLLTETGVGYRLVAGDT